MKRLVIGLNQCGKVLIGKVLRKDGALSAGIGEDKTIIEVGGYRIIYGYGPALQDTTMWIGGNSKESSDNVFFHDYDSPEDASFALSMFKMMINRINQDTDIDINSCGLDII